MFCKIKKPNKQQITTLIIIFLFIFVSLFSMRTILQQDGVIGMRHDWPIPSYSSQLQDRTTEIFYIWTPKSLGSNTVYPACYLFRLLVESFSFVGFDGEMISKAFIIFVMALSGISLFYLAKTLKLNIYSSSIAGFFYMLTPVMFNKIIAGHLYYLLGYALTPFIIAFFIKVIDTKKVQYKYLIGAGLLYALSGSQIQFFMMIFLFLFILCLTKDSKETIRRFFLLGIILTIVFLMHLVWILPIVANISYVSSSLTSSLGTQALSYHEIQNGPEIINALKLEGYSHPYTYSKLASKSVISPLLPIFEFLIVIFSFLAIILKPKDKRVLFFSFVAIIVLFLCKAINPPIGQIFSWLFLYTPLGIFREVSHLIFIPALCYAVLMGVTFQSLSERIKPNLKIIKLCKLKKETIMTIVMVLIISMLSYPMLSGNFVGQLQTYELGPEYKQVYDKIYDEKEDFRVLWTPMVGSIQYDNLNYSGTDPLIFYSPKPSFSRNVYPFTSDANKYQQFISMNLYDNRTKFLGNLLSISTAKYIIYRDNYYSKLPNFTPMGIFPHLASRWNNNQTKQTLDSQLDLELIEKRGNISIYNNKNVLHHIYIPQNLAVVAGDFSTFTSSDYFSINNMDAAAFVQQVDDDLIARHINKIMITNNNYFDYLTSSVDKQYMIDPGCYTTYSDPKKGWINARNWWWFDWHFTAALENGAFTRSIDILEIPLHVSDSGMYELWIKTWMWVDSGGHMKFYLDDDKIGSITTNSHLNYGFRWIKVSTLNMSQGNHQLNITNNYGENYIGKIIFAPQQIIQESYNKALNSSKEKSIIHILEAETNLDQQSSNLIKNPSFEKYSKYQNTPDDWSSPNSNFYGSSVSSNNLDDTHHYCLTTNSEEKTWSRLRSNNILVTPGRNYKIVTHMKYNNTRQSHIAIDVYNSTGWYQIMQCPTGQDGTSDWKEFDCTLKIPDNITDIRLILNAGWVMNYSKGNATTCFDNFEMYPEMLISDKHGVNASNGDVFLIQDNRKIWTPISLFKDGNYTLAVRFADENINKNLEIGVDNKIYTIRSGNNTGLSWYKINNITLEKGTYNLSFKFSQDSLLKNPSFEEYYTSFKPKYWFDLSDAFSGSLVSFTKQDGIYSYRLTTDSKEKVWSRFKSKDITVKPKQKYRVITHIKYSNTKQSHISIEAYDSGEWYQIIQSPAGQDGTLDWSEFSYILEIPDNITKIRFVLNAGGVLDSSKGNATTWFDNIKIYPVTTYNEIDLIVLYSTDINHTYQKESKAKIENSRKINPTKYTFDIIDANNPFFLVFSESYDSGWNVFIDGDKQPSDINHFTINGFANGWYIEETGNYTVVLEYAPQHLYEFGLKVALVVFVILIVILLVPEISFRNITRNFNLLDKKETPKQQISPPTQPKQTPLDQELKQELQFMDCKIGEQIKMIKEYVEKHKS